MILYFERKADKDGKRRIEVSVEEIDTWRGKRYLQVDFCKIEEQTVGEEVLFENREECLRNAIALFDLRKATVCWPEEAT